MRWRALYWLSLWCVGCSGDFTPYQEIDRLRVLAVGADRPWLRFGETASISALVVQAIDDDAPLTYEWSWCPLSSGNDRAYECAFTEEELQRQIDEAAGPGLVEVPPYALGSTATVAFSYQLSPLLFRGLCDAIAMQVLPDFVAVPECAGTFPITVRLTVSDGDEEVTAIRELELVYDDQVTEVNTNPLIIGARANSSTITADGALELERDINVSLSLDLVSSEAEQLVVSWFVENGDLDSARTTNGKNIWRTPRVPDHPEQSARLFFVARDDRRGVSWLSRRVRLMDPP